jgi:hypothetical protein
MTYVERGIAKSTRPDEFFPRFNCKASAPPAEERVTFLTPGILPSAPSGPAALFAPLLQRSASAKKVTKESSPRAARLTGPRLGGFLPQKQEHSLTPAALQSCATQSRDGRVSNTL